jgi:hypothetical protein
MAGTCEMCDMGLDHCHGVVVEHPDGSYECADGCGAGLAVHDELVTCAELGLGCCPTDSVVDDRPKPAFASAA